jgi:hypothetical protein
MTEFMEPESGDVPFKPNGHEPGASAARRTGPEAEHLQWEYSSVVQQRELPMDPEDEASNEADLRLIDEILNELSGSRRPTRQSGNLAEQAATLVARHGNQASTEAIFRKSAMRLTRDWEPAQHHIDTLPDGWDDAASAARLENVALIKALFKAASQAGSEREAGLQVALSVPLMIQQYRKVSSDLWASIPALSVGMSALARFLYRSEATRALLLDLPRVLHAALDRLAWYASHHRAITSRLASTVLAEQAGIWLASRTRRSPKDSQARSMRPPVDPIENEEE